MSDTPVFVNGLIFKLPHENAPDFVKGKLSIKVADFGQWLRDNKDAIKDGWINVDLKVSRAGKAYACLDTWVPKAQEGFDPNTGTGSDPMPGDDLNADIPFS